MTRIQTIDNALHTGALLEFDYMPLGQGRRAIERRRVLPLGWRQSLEGHIIVTAEDLGRRGRPRSYRLRRMFHVHPTEA